MNELCFAIAGRPPFVWAVHPPPQCFTARWLMIESSRRYKLQKTPSLKPTNTTNTSIGHTEGGVMITHSARLAVDWDNVSTEFSQKGERLDDLSPKTNHRLLYHNNNNSLSLSCGIPTPTPPKWSKQKPPLRSLPEAEERNSGTPLE